MEGNIYIQQIQGAVELEIEVLNGKANSLKTTCLYIYISRHYYLERENRHNKILIERNMKEAFDRGLRSFMIKDKSRKIVYNVSGDINGNMANKKMT